MTIEILWRDALLAALSRVPGLNRVGDGDGESAGFPFAVLGEIVGLDWGAKGRAGRELRFAVVMQDRGEAERIGGLVRAVEDVLAAMPRVLAD